MKQIFTFLFLTGIIMGMGNTLFSQCVPDPPLDLGPDVTLCEGDTLELMVSGQYDSVAWSTGSMDTLIQVTTAGSYSVRVVDNDTCIGWDTIMVTVSPLPVPDLGPSVVEACVGDTIVLDAGPGFQAYLWNDPLATTDQDLAVSSAVPLSGFEVIVRVKNQADCAGFDTAYVSFFDYPTVTIAPGDTALCGPATITLNATSGLINYLWSTGDTTPSIDVSASGNYAVYAETGGGCGDLSDSVNIEIYPEPAIPVILKNGDQFEVTPIQTGATYQWFLDSLPITGGETGVLNHGDVPGSYYVEVTSAQGCPASAPSDTVQIPVPNPIPTFAAEYIPELITPNGDNTNDELIIYNLDQFPNNELVILNRYGQEVFKATGYDNLTDLFDGTGKNGNPLPDGTYYYLLELNSSDYGPFKGFIVISR